MSETASPVQPEVERQTMDVDIVCVGFGPAAGGFLTTLSRALSESADGTSAIESTAMPGMPLQVICYERADDIGFGVSGVVTRARGIKESLKDLDASQVPLAVPVKQEKLVYLLDPIGASRRSLLMKMGDGALRIVAGMLGVRDHAFELPWIPPFLNKHGGLVMSIGQFNQSVGSQLMAGGAVQIWPATPVDAPLLDGQCVTGVRLADQGTDRHGTPDASFMPGMDIRAALTVVADGPVGAIGRQLDEKFGMPQGNHKREWALGMKVVVDLREDTGLEPGTVIHTFGFPEPEIFGFFYVHADRVASAGIFVPSWFTCPVRTAYRYLQHWMQHPYMWKLLGGGTLRSFGAKSLLESGQVGEPYLAGDGYARIGEGSGSTNVLTGSGVDEAWQTGVQLAEGVVELLREKKPFTRAELERVYVGRRRESWVEEEARIARHARDGFANGFVTGMIGMGLSGMTRGAVNMSGVQVPPQQKIASLEDYYGGIVSAEEIAEIRARCTESGTSLHDALMDRAGWPQVELDGSLLVSHQDALLLGGKVQAPGGYRDHVRFADRSLCAKCTAKVCVEMCSGQAITMSTTDGVPDFDREKCVHCGACLWNCAHTHPTDHERTNVEFVAGAGGFHSAEN